MITATYFMSRIDMRLLYALMAIAAAVVVFSVMVALMPSVIGCCAIVAPIIAKLAVGAVVIAAFAFVTKPK